MYMSRSCFGGVIRHLLAQATEFRAGTMIKSFLEYNDLITVLIYYFQKDRIRSCVGAVICHLRVDRFYILVHLTEFRAGTVLKLFREKLCGIVCALLL